MRKKILSLALAIIMVMTLLPATTCAASGGTAMSLDAENNFDISGDGTNWVYFGEHTGNPIKWRVLSSHGNGGTCSDGATAVANPMFLISEYMFDAVTPFGKEYYTGTWQGSKAQEWCQNFALTHFESKELETISATAKDDEAYTSTSSADEDTSFIASDKILDGDLLFFLSAEEAESAEYGFSDNADRVAETISGIIKGWWTRSKFAGTDYNFGYVKTDGMLYRTLSEAVNDCRPAMNLNTSKVLFASAAAGGKVSGPTGADALAAVSDTAPMEWKLTLLDSSRNFSIGASGTHLITKPGDATPNLNYNNATSGANEYISALITDADDNIEYYGRLKAVSTGQENGTISVSIPADIADGEYTLRLFSEQYNGDQETDYAGELQDIRLKIDTTAPVVTNVTPGADAPLNGSIVITFSDEIDVPVGAVSLDGGTTFLTGGSFSDDRKVYTVPYSGLSYNKEYTVTISGFVNAIGLSMELDYPHTFTTKSKSTGSSSGRTYYTIEASAGAGGSISPSGKISVAKGNDKTFTVNADKEYEIEDVLADDESVGDVSTYTFKNVKNTHTIKASFKKTETASINLDAVNPFADVDQVDWFHESVIYVYKNGLMNGTGNDTFSPADGMTRGMIVTVLYRMNGGTGNYTDIFSDIASGAWYENAAAWAADNGIVNGVGDKRFAPGKTLTREQLALMLYNYAKYKGLNTTVTDNDVLSGYADTGSISSWAEEAMKWAVSAGVITGNDSRLNPQASASRAEVAAMLYRFIENVIS